MNLHVQGLLPHRVNTFTRIEAIYPSVRMGFQSMRAYRLIQEGFMQGVRDAAEICTERTIASLPYSRSHV